MDLKSGAGNAFLVFFIVANLLLSSFFLDTQQRWNSTSRMLTVLAVCHYGTLQIDRFHERTGDKCFINGHYYSEKAPLPALIAIPFYYLVKSPLDLKNDEKGLIGRRAYIIGDIICGSLPFVFILSLLFLKLQKEKTVRFPGLLSTLPFYGSFTFLYAGAFMNHLLSAAFLIVAYLLLKDKKNFFLSGVFAGLAFLSDFSLAIVLPVWSLQIFYNQKFIKNSLFFILGFLPSLLFLLAYNYAITGDAFKMLYQFVSDEDFLQARNTLGFTSIHPSALWKMLFSEYRGIFLYFPVLILILMVFLKHVRVSKELFWGNYLFLFAASHYLLISSHEIWWGGACVGPRHLIPVAFLVAFEGLRFLAKRDFYKIFFVVLTLGGVVLIWMAESTVGYRIPDEMEYPFTEGIFSMFLEKKFNSGNILTMLFDIPAGIAVCFWLAMFVLFISTIYFLYERSGKKLNAPTEKNSGQNENLY